MHEIDPEVFGQVVGTAIKEALEPIKDRLAELERKAVTKSLDAEAFDELAEMAKRLDDIEAHAWKYRGYWRDGMSAKRGDAVTHNGSLFYCLEDTTETPDGHSLDWNVLARKGRDGKDSR